MAWFLTTATSEDAKNDVDLQALYACDRLFYWDVEIQALSSCVWKDVIAVEDGYQSYFGMGESKRSLQVGDEMKRMCPMASGTLVKENVDVDICRYWYYGERLKVQNICALSTEILDSWRWRYMVHEDAICWTFVIQLACLQYINWNNITCWSKQKRRERRKLSIMGSFVPYHLWCAYVLCESARDRLMLCIPPNYKIVEVVQGSRFEQESMF